MYSTSSGNQITDSKMDNFGDGEAHLGNIKADHGSLKQECFSAALERHKKNTGHHVYGKNIPEQAISDDEFKSSYEIMNHSSVVNYGSRSGSFMADKNGGHNIHVNISGTTTNSQLRDSKLTNQFQRNYSKSGLVETSRSAMSSSQLLSSVCRNVNTQQRFPAAQTMSQSSTPTLNHLLQTPNPQHQGNYNSNQNIQRGGSTGAPSSNYAGNCNNMPQGWGTVPNTNYQEHGAVSNCHNQAAPYISGQVSPAHPQFDRSPQMTGFNQPRGQNSPGALSDIEGMTSEIANKESAMTGLKTSNNQLASHNANLSACHGISTHRLSTSPSFSSSGCQVLSPLSGNYSPSPAVPQNSNVPSHSTYHNAVAMGSNHSSPSPNQPSHQVQNFGNANYVNSRYGNTPSPVSCGMNNVMSPPCEFSKYVVPSSESSQGTTQEPQLARTYSAGVASSVVGQQQCQPKIYNNVYNSNLQQQQQQQQIKAETVSNVMKSGNLSKISFQQHSDEAVFQEVSSSPYNPNISSLQQYYHVSSPRASTTLSAGIAQSADNIVPSNGCQQMPMQQTGISTSTSVTTTTVTQSICSPLPSVIVTVTSPSVVNSYDYQHSIDKKQFYSGHYPGTPPTVFDEGSQASSISASSSIPDEHSLTVKANIKAISHPPTPNTIPSPGAASLSSLHDEHDSISSPSCPRTPVSPRSDGLMKLYELSDEPGRRIFLDKLLISNEERGFSMSQCPTVCKQPLDLYRLYIAVKERGGYLEVTRSKQWKYIAGAVNLGASSSASYTLRKQYIKHLLPYECRFDCGGIDPQNVIQSESSMRKKNSKNVIHSPGPVAECYPQQPMNQMVDAYSPPASGMQYSNSPHMIPYQTQYHQQQPSIHHNEMTANVPANSSCKNAQNMYMDNKQQYCYTSSGGYSQMPSNVSQYPAAQSAASDGSYYRCSPVGLNENPSQTYGHNVIASDDANYNVKNADAYGSSNSYSPHRRVQQTDFSQYPCQGSWDQERYNKQYQDQQNPQIPSQPNVVMPPAQGDQCTYSSHQYNEPNLGHERTVSQPGFHNSEATYNNQYPVPRNRQSLTHSSYPHSQQYVYPATENSGTTQSCPSTQQSFDQTTSYQNKMPCQSNLQKDMYSGNVADVRHPETVKSTVMNQNEYLDNSGQQQQNQRLYATSSRSGNNFYHQTPPNQGQNLNSSYNTCWDGYKSDLHRGKPQSTSIHSDGFSPSKVMAFSPGSKVPFVGNKALPQFNKINEHPEYPSYHCTPYQRTKEVIMFPPDSVEAVTSVRSKRQRLLPKDVVPVEAWRIMMSLKSGLLAESTWALNVLSALLHDDNTVLYFGLSHLPGLLEILLEHYRRCLNLIFGLTDDLEVGFDCQNNNSSLQKDCKKSSSKWYDTSRDIFANSACDTLTKSSINNKDKVNLIEMENFTYKTRCGKIVRIRPDDALFLLDATKKWDVYEGFTSGTDHWQLGKGDITIHIETCMENSLSVVKFVRIMKDKSDDNCTNGKYKKVLIESNDECSENCINCKLKDLKLPFVNCKKEPVVLLEDLKFCQKKKNVDDKDKEKISIQEEKLEESRLQEAVEVKNVEAEPVLEEKPVTENKDEENICKSQTELENSEEKGKVQLEFPRIRQSSRKRPRGEEELEDEAYCREEPVFAVEEDMQDALAKRCVCISTVLHNLSFIPGNDIEMCRHSGFLLVMARLVLLHHVHSPKQPKHHYDKEEEKDREVLLDASYSVLNSEQEWWWDMLHILRENTLITLANIASQLDLASYPEEISLPLLDGLLHWVVCPSAYAQDPLPSQAHHSVLSPQRLSLETLCKLSVFSTNVDLILATPPWVRIENLFAFLSKSLNHNEDQVVREFSVVLLSNLSQADSGAARAIAMQGSCISQLITFLEQAEQSAFQIATSQGMKTLRENPELMGTTLEMVRRAASTLKHLACIPENRPLFMRNQRRLLALVMSQILDQGVASVVADILYECSCEGYNEEGGDDSEIEPNEDKEKNLETLSSVAS